MQDCEFLIEIFVPGAGESGSIGTGYPVAPDRIITARHVLGDNPSNAQVRWYYAPDTGADPKLRRWIDVNPVKLVFDDKGLDIAVIECAFPDGLQDSCPIREELLPKQANWLSEGFIAAGKRSDRRNAEAYSGAVENDRERDGTMVLNVTSPPEFAKPGAGGLANRGHDSLWRGGSGSPVIASAGLAGVITSCPPQYGAKRLRAVPMHTLLQKELFRKAIDYDDQVRVRDTIARDATQILMRSEDLIDTVIRRLRMGGLPNDSSKKASRVVETLFGLSVGDFLKTIDAVHESLMEVGKQDDSRTLLDLTHVMLPGLRGIAGQHVYAGAGETNARNWHCPTMLTMPAACPTVAEVLMANREGRRTRFETISNSADYPVGESKLDEKKLTLRIEAGINPGPSDLDAAIEFLKQDCNLVSADDLRDDHTKEFYIKLLQSAFRRLQEKNRSYYFALRLPTKKDELNRWANLVRELKSLFPGLTFIRLSNDETMLLDERDKYAPLQQIYRRHKP